MISRSGRAPFIGACALAAACATPAPPDAAAPVRSRSAAVLAGPVIADAVDLNPDATIVRYELTAERLPGGSVRYGYNGTSPGPTLRARVGDTVVVSFTNALDVATTVHWHGMHVPNAMDGVPMMQGDDEPMGLVPPGGAFEYRFVADHAGTFWYHPHFDTDRQVDLGSYGAFIVEDPTEPVVDELVLVLDVDGEHHAESPAHGRGALLQDWRVNGEALPTFTVDAGSTVRARFINASSVGYAVIDAPNARLIATDQGLLPAPEPIDGLVLAPSDRAEVELRFGSTGSVVTTQTFSLNGGETALPPEDLVRFVVAGTGELPPVTAWPEHDGTPTPDPGYADAVWALQGSDRTGDWRINGARFPDTEPMVARLGDAVILEVRNVSPTRHPFHLHGMAFELLSRDGIPPARQTIEDTIDIGIHERVRLRVFADNPGVWMAHCHILPHAEDGMMSTLRVE